MTPHLVKWHETYAAQGLTIIDVDNAQADTLEVLREHVRSERLPFLVLHSADACDLYGIEGFPSAYLIDRQGKVIWEGVPLDDLEGEEALIRKALEQGSVAVNEAAASRGPRR